jgi:carboxymethylenebutenolidase
MISENLSASTAMIKGSGDETIEAYEARPHEERRRGGVVVIHHMPGFDRETKEIVRRFAAMGYDAVCPNLYWREAPGAAPDDAAAVARARGGVPDTRLIGDVAGVAAYLRALDSSNGKVGVIGYCSGGRQSVLAACNVDLDAAVDCYGAFVTGSPPDGFPIPITNLVDHLPAIRCPLLGLFGEEDKYPAPEDVHDLDEMLTVNGKEHEFHTYAGAGHSFFSVDRPAYRPEAAIDGWERIGDFFGRCLAA